MEKTFIDISDYRQSGEGAIGVSYDCISDPDIMLKMYKESYPDDAVTGELEIARKVYSLGIPTPKPGDLVTDGSRLGIRFRRIRGKRSYSRMIQQEPERLDELTREFARECKMIHGISCPEGMFQDARVQFKYYLDCEKTLTPSQKDKVRAFIDSVPECGNCLHGDMHIGNAISTLVKGAPLSSPHDIYFIDLGNFGRGYPLFDVAMMMQSCVYADDYYVQEMLHLDRAAITKVWDSFMDEYFFGEEKIADRLLGPGQTVESVQKAMKPFVGCIQLFISFAMGYLPENLRLLLLDCFDLG